MDNQPLIFIIIFFMAINLNAFFIMYLDKERARKQKTERISEGFMFFLATAFGSVGIWAGMFRFHHKSKKWHFVIGIPLLIIQNCITLWLIYAFFGGFIILK